MLGDAVSAKKASGEAADTLEVIDVAQLLARSVQTGTPAHEGGADEPPGGGERVGTVRSEDTGSSPPTRS
jgi:hypothetical protein